MSVTALLSRIQALETKSTFVATPLASAGWSLHDLDGTILVSDQTGTSGSWTTWDLSKQVPSGATHVLLECWSLQDDPDGGHVLSPLYVRRDSKGVQLLACAGRAAGSADGTGSSAQCICAVSGSQTIDYNASSDFVHWQVRLLGWFG